MTKHQSSTYHFQVEWGVAVFSFNEVSGLSNDLKPGEHHDWAIPEVSMTKMPGQPKYNTITLKRGVFHSDNEIKDLRNIIQPYTKERNDIIIKLLNEEGSIIKSWKVKNAWPVKIQSTDLKADGNEVAIEVLEFAHEGISIVPN